MNDHLAITTFDGALGKYRFTQTGEQSAETTRVAAFAVSASAFSFEKTF